MFSDFQVTGGRFSVKWKGLLFYGVVVRMWITEQNKSHFFPLSKGFFTLRSELGVLILSKGYLLKLTSTFKQTVLHYILTVVERNRIRVADFVLGYFF